MFILQLAQVQALGARPINRIFKRIIVQTYNCDINVTSVSLKLDKKADQTAICLYSGPLYHTLTQSRSIHIKQIFTLFEIFEKHYGKLISNNIHKIKSKLAHILAFS